MADYDLLVIGSGPGGYVAAIRGAQLGMKTALVEKDSHLGGTCLNVGCIPSKALLHSTEIYHFLHERGDAHGIKVGKLTSDIPALMKRKDGVVDQLRNGVTSLIKARKIDVLKGIGSFQGEGKVNVEGAEGGKTVTATNIIIATGSVPVELPFMKFDGDVIVSSTEGIAFDKIPKKLVVVGGGAIGLELGSVWSRLGSEVTIVEMLPQIAGAVDKDVSKLAERLFKKQGMKFELGAKVTGVVKEGKKSFLTAEKNGKELKFEADKILVAVGRKPTTAGLHADKGGIELDEKGRVKIDSHFRTSAKGVYAIGDVVSGPMLAHKAEEEGVACVELIAGKGGHVNYDVIPNVVYTEPEIASVGIGEDLAKEQDIEVNVGKFPLIANGRAIATDATDGFVKVIADKKTDKLLGVQIIAKGASELIAAAVTHMEYGGSAEDLGRTIHAHPTMAESMKEAGLSVSKTAIHSM
ncbi:dihydrolipoyl dehydrogenase [Cerasicoccus arenae]|uniref:Dihydrolipoyl dehydrogenase n=1 Tax=Cerasicoccus arenae TaxID=424488 RepID=A0A8J3GD22_9BACT|nr:dihydrolipoyl dehydrogenase [Cerasicoccus arenae]MBK1859151.1 dihydrolipoyl dehydrogenase [Cerasicoccus arenae]GHB98152.1 dihydrolipoyl dehydrogenase [Cerasicoccus arenae]